MATKLNKFNFGISLFKIVIKYLYNMTIDLLFLKHNKFMKYQKIYDIKRNCVFESLLLNDFLRNNIDKYKLKFGFVVIKPNQNKYNKFIIHPHCWGVVNNKQEEIIFETSHIFYCTDVIYIDNIIKLRQLIPDINKEDETNFSDQLIKIKQIL